MNLLQTYTCAMTDADKVRGNSTLHRTDIVNKRQFTCWEVWFWSSTTFFELHWDDNKDPKYGLMSELPRFRWQMKTSTNTKTSPSYYVLHQNLHFEQWMPSDNSKNSIIQFMPMDIYVLWIFLYKCYIMIFLSKLNLYGLILWNKENLL